MSEKGYRRRSVRRITCSVHQRLSFKVREKLFELNPRSVIVESGRSVRQLVKVRPYFFAGPKVTLDDSPVDLYRFTALPDEAEPVMRALAAAAYLEIPGHGTIFSQEMEEFAPEETGEEFGCSPDGNSPPAPAAPQARSLIRELSLITFILSMPGSGEHLAKVALELGTCVPVVTHGIGTGMRDRLGLLRIAIPPEKEVVHLLVPSHDVEGIISLMVEEVRLNLPGRGFIYSTPVESGLLDTRLRLGKQEHAASYEQIIAAIDDLKNGTTWRKRFITAGQETSKPLRRSSREITVLCREGSAVELTQTAMTAGAGGATVSRVKRICTGSAESGTAARERITIHAGASSGPSIVEAVKSSKLFGKDPADSIQIIESPIVYFYWK